MVRSLGLLRHRIELRRTGHERIGKKQERKIIVDKKLSPARVTKWLLRERTTESLKKKPLIDLVENGIGSRNPMARVQWNLTIRLCKKLNSIFENPRIIATRNWTLCSERMKNRRALRRRYDPWTCGQEWNAEFARAKSHTYPSEPEGHRTQKRPRFREMYWDLFVKFYDVRVHILFSVVWFSSFIGRFKLGRPTQNGMFSFWRPPQHARRVWRSKIAIHTVRCI